MTRLSRATTMRCASMFAAAVCLAGASAFPAHADEAETPLLPAPPTAEPVTESDAASDSAWAELLATPREGSPADYLQDQATAGMDRRTAQGSESESDAIHALAGIGSISGTITQGYRGTDLVDPLQGALVYAMQWSDADQDYVIVGSATSGADGHYTVGGLATGDYLVLVDAGDPTKDLLPEFWPDAPLPSWAEFVAVVDGQDSPGIDEVLEPLLKDYIAGQDRYETSVAISASAFEKGVPCVYVASGTNFPDALSAAPAAAKCGGPLLLVRPTAVPDVVYEEIDYLDPAEIVIAGGPGAVSASVAAQLSELAPVRRISGSDRYETSRRIIADAFDSAEAIWVATGTNFPDALSASGAASAASLPVLIVPGNAPALDGASASTIASLSPRIVAVAGGTGVVSTGIESDLWDAGFEVARFGGANRYDTSRLINEAVWSVADGGWSVYAFMANGLTFPDALSGAPLAGGYLGAPLYVVPPVCTPAEVLNHVDALGVHEVYLLGYFSKLDFDGKPFRTC